MTYTLYNLEEFFYAINTYNADKCRINHFFEEYPADDIKYIQKNFLSICDDSYHLEINIIEYIIKNYYWSKHGDPGPNFETNMGTGEYEIKYNMHYEFLKNFAIACGYVTKRSKQLKNAQFLKPDECDEKINDLINEIIKIEYDESYWNNWPQIRSELKEHYKTKIKK